MQIIRFIRTASVVSTTAVNTATLSVASTATTGTVSQAAGANANTNKDKDGAAASSYAVSGVAAFAVAGLVAILA